MTQTINCSTIDFPGQFQPVQEFLAKALEIANGCWRFRWWGLLGAWVAALVGWLLVAAIPNTYEATAKVYVDTETVLQPLIRGIAAESLDVSEQMGLVSTQMLSRPVLERVVREVGLVTDESPANMDSAAQNLLRSINLQATRTHRPVNPEPPNLYLLGARSTDPKVALAIVDTLLDIFVEDAIDTTRQDSGAATGFLRQQIDEYERRLSNAEKKLTEFKRENIGRLPEQGQNFYARLQMTQNSLDAAELELRQQEYRRQSIQNQLAAVNPSQRAIGSNGTPVLSPTEQRIQALEQRLDELRLQYTDQHPEIVSIRNSLDRLRNPGTADDGSLGDAQTETNPMYRELRLQLGQTEADIAAITVRRDEFARKVDELKAQIETLPQIEAQLAALNRDYDVTQANYNELLKRLESAQLRTEADATGQNVKFRIVEPPTLPRVPIFPNRTLFSGAATLVAIAVGLSIAFMLGQLRGAFSSLSQLTAFSRNHQVSILGTVGYQAASGEGQYGGKLFFITGVFLLFVAFALVMWMFLNGFQLRL